MSTPPYHVFEFSIGELRNVLTDYYQDVELAGQQHIDVSRLTIHKGRIAASTLAASVLSRVPFGRQVRQILARAVMPQSRRINFNHDFEQAADPKYAVVPLGSTPGQTPTTFVAVARKQAQQR